MKRSALGVLSIVAAALLAACGGGDSGSGSAISVPQASSGGQAGALRQQMTAPQQAAVDKRLKDAKGKVQVWVALDVHSMARARALLTGGGQAGRAKALDSSTPEGSAVAAQMRAQRAAIQAQQTAFASRVTSLGATILGKVRVSHNAVAVEVNASQVSALAAMPGVLRVRPVLHYQLDLSETVPYVGATAAHQAGIDGSGVRVAVLDSGVDYTHAAFGGPGTAAAYEAAYGTSPADPKNTTRDGLFPTAKVVAGHDFVGESWPNGARTEDPDPIDYEGHGTHVADIIAGANGVAPGAKIVAVKVCSAVASSCNGVALLLGMDYALDPNGDMDPADAVDVINLSLGSGYGQIEDDLTLATSNAVDMGVIVVASAGNSADRPYIVGSPSVGAGVISVAQTQVPGALAIPAVINAPAAIAGIYGNTATLDWAPIGSGVTGDVVYVGRGCATPNDPYLANPAGKIALIDRGACNISEKVDRAARAGAIGVFIGLVAPGDAVSFSLGGGSMFVPSLVIQQSLSNAIKAQLAGGQVVNATMSPAAAIALKGSFVGSSSRGPSTSLQAIKPEIGAPGGSVSAEVGTGTGTTAFGGTSGAAPMVSGAAALMVQANPTLSPLQIKAMLMNSAETTIYTNPAVRPGVLAPITRIGGGELRVDRALALDTAAWDKQALSATVAFGFVEAHKQVTMTRTLTVENYSATPRNFTITPTFRYANDRASEAVKLLVGGSVSVPAHSSRDVTVTMVINPAKLPNWTLDGGEFGGDGSLLDLPEYDGYITLTDGNERLSVPWHVLPRKSSLVVGTLLSGSRGSNAIALRNTGAAPGEWEAFSLIGTSGQQDPTSQPLPGDNFASIDLKEVGVRYLPPSIAGGHVLQFAITNYTKRAHPNYPAEFDLYIDTTGDNDPDYVIYNAEASGFGVTGQNRVYVAPLNPSGAGSSVFYVDADLNSGTLIFSVLLNTQGLPPSLPSLNASLGTTLNIDLYAFDNYFTGFQTDSIEGMRFTPGLPRYRVTTPQPFGTVAIGRSTTVPWAKNAAVTPAQSTERGLLMIYRRNANESQRFALP